MEKSLKQESWRNKESELVDWDHNKQSYSKAETNKNEVTILVNYR